MAHNHQNDNRRSIISFWFVLTSLSSLDFRFLLGKFRFLNRWKLPPFSWAMQNLELTPEQLTKMIQEWSKFHPFHFCLVHRVWNKIILLLLYIPILRSFFIKNNISTNNYIFIQRIVEAITLRTCVTTNEDEFLASVIKLGPFSYDTWAYAILPNTLKWLIPNFLLLDRSWGVLSCTYLIGAQFVK